MTPNDVGFCTLPGQQRSVYLLVHRKFGRWIAEPEVLYRRVKERLKVHTNPSVDVLYWETDAVELKKELSHTGTSTQNLPVEDMVDWTPYLNAKEKQALRWHLEAECGDRLAMLPSLSRVPSFVCRWVLHLYSKYMYCS